MICWVKEISPWRKIMTHQPWDGTLLVIESPDSHPHTHPPVTQPVLSHTRAHTYTHIQFKYKATPIRNNDEYIEFTSLIGNWGGWTVEGSQNVQREHRFCRQFVDPETWAYVPFKHMIVGNIQENQEQKVCAFKSAVAELNSGYLGLIFSDLDFSSYEEASTCSSRVVTQTKLTWMFYSHFQCNVFMSRQVVPDRVLFLLSCYCCWKVCCFLVRNCDQTVARHGRPWRHL